MSNYYIGNIVCGNELTHHGIIGQRWGFRRFQNPDGSLTPEGRIRYGSGKERKESRDSKTGLTSYEKKLRSSKNPKKRDMYYAQIRKETDFRHIKDKKIKADGEKKILEMNDLSGDEFSNLPIREQDKYAELFNRIAKESGDYYNQEPVTKDFENKMNEMNRNREEIDRLRHANKNNELFRLGQKHLNGEISDDEYDNKRAKIYEEIEKYRETKQYREKLDKLYDTGKKLDNDICGIVLKDIGYEDTPEARRLISYMIFWD